MFSLQQTSPGQSLHNIQTIYRRSLKTAEPNISTNKTDIAAKGTNTWTPASQMLVLWDVVGVHGAIP